MNNVITISKDNCLTVKDMAEYMVLKDKKNHYDLSTFLISRFYRISSSDVMKLDARVANALYLKVMEWMSEPPIPFKEAIELDKNEIKDKEIISRFKLMDID